MIRIFLGNLGSGKSASAIREIATDESGMVTYTNLITKHMKNVKTIKPQNIIKKTTNEKGKQVLDLNTDFWIKQKKPLNVLWDEIHLTANARASMSKVNMIFSRFLAMGRRITGYDERGYGTLTFVAQKERTIDVNVKDLCSEIIYHIGHWIMICKDCGVKIARSSEQAQSKQCLLCKSWRILREGFFIERLRFDDLDKYFEWAVNKKMKTYNQRVMIQDIDEYFHMYNTMQMENMWQKYIDS